MPSIHTVQIQFPEITLTTRDAHKIRGYFGRLFETHSPLLHNHLEGGGHRYAYPLVQYKVLNQVPTLIGLEEGARLLTELFLKIKELSIEGKCFQLTSKHIKSGHTVTGIADELFRYQFQTLWMALNQQNYQRYRQEDEIGQKQILQRIAIGNILSFLKGLNIFIAEQERIMIKLELEPKKTRFKDQEMLGFTGHFTTNAILPDYIGLGKAVSRGFGTIKLIN